MERRSQVVGKKARAKSRRATQRGNEEILRHPGFGKAPALAHLKHQRQDITSPDRSTQLDELLDRRGMARRVVDTVGCFPEKSPCSPWWVCASHDHPTLVVAEGKSRDDGLLAAKRSRRRPFPNRSEPRPKSMVRVEFGEERCAVPARCSLRLDWKSAWFTE